MYTSENRKAIKCVMSIGSALALALLVFYSFYPSLDNEFVSWDDQFYITLNPFVTHPTWSHLGELWSVIISLNYHPLTMSSLWLNSYWSGIESATPFIMTNIVFHFGNSILVYYVLSHLFPKHTVMSLFATLVFALHPMHVESVVWVSERKDVLYAFFFLASLLSYIIFSDTRENRFYLLAFLFFILSCLSKAMAVSLVPILLIVDYIRNETFHLKDVINKIPFFIIALLFGGIALNIQSGGDFGGLLEIVANEKALANNATVTFWERLSYGSYSLMFYIVKFFWPSDLAAFHPYDDIISGPYFMLSPIVFLGIFVLSILFYRKSKELLFGLIFFMCTIFLVLQFLPVGAALVAERYSYLPYVGLALMLGKGLQYIYDRYSKSGVVVLLVLNTVAMSLLTRQQSDVWQNQVSLFSQVVDHYPENAASRHYLATGYWEQGEYDKSIRHLKYAIDTLYSLTDTNFELLASAYAEKNDTRKAIAYYNEAVNINPNNVVARYHRALLLVDTNPTQVIEDLTMCEQSDNIYVTQFIYTPRGRAYGQLGQYELAISDFRKAIEITPQDVWNYYDLGLTYELNNDFKSALAIYENGLTIDPYFESIKERKIAIENTLKQGN